MMVGCGMRKRGIKHGSEVFDLNDWISGNTKIPRSRRLQQRSIN